MHYSFPFTGDGGLGAEAGRGLPSAGELGGGSKMWAQGSSLK